MGDSVPLLLMEKESLYRKYPATFFLFLSIYVCVVSWRLGLGSLHKPGSGFMPFWSGAFIGVLALLLFAQDLWSDRTKGVEEGKEKVNWKSIALTLIYFLVYILSLEYIGFIIATLLFVGIILKSIEKKGWFLATWVSVVMAIASYYVFKIWLQAELPKGFLGF
jgi:putative tricarboxylic transport membrane protein